MPRVSRHHDGSPLMEGLSVDQERALRLAAQRDSQLVLTEPNSPVIEDDDVGNGIVEDDEATQPNDFIAPNYQRQGSPVWHQPDPNAAQRADEEYDEEETVEEEAVAPVARRVAPRRHNVSHGPLRHRKVYTASTVP